ncbi:glycoside hydrolase family 2 TIM barrel-domain containing protein [Botrimarina mediterranea]|uniref:Beta-galactosidase n=1 Tax=Botrimarina mediterranea TaxID=2528022 RepID=A0A518K9E2_9BACT|nr:glycoside hydrolase family 2 TIM barrel-domain containing protein [Botrimarina mediterranea]QDV74411.1 Beta-galactosidase [Botrimarina mediterranea]QDV79007.1 Beta-galactosidase [Planctomycetes bacterium K2D]
MRIAALFAVCLASAAIAGERRLLDSGWRFHQGDVSGAEGLEFDDRAWRRVDLPHDWSVESSPTKDAMSEGGGGYHIAGVGWYRRELPLEASKLRPQPPSAVIRLEFEGVYRNSEVWFNGRPLGKHAYGYTPFSFDVTDRVRFDRPNVIAVRVDNSGQPNSRWHSGSGIYRHIWLRTSSEVTVPADSLWVRTKELRTESAAVEVAYDIDNATERDLDLLAHVTLRDTSGAIVAETTERMVSAAGERAPQVIGFEVASPQAWSIETPTFYAAQIDLLAVSEHGEQVLIDSVSQRCGLRTISIDPQQGLLLNGERVVLFGGNVHHDHGPLGAASFDDAERRRVRLLKAAGFNAVRTSHNPPSEAFLDACDERGMLVLDEAFDSWRKPKLKHDYSEDFDAHWREDLAAMVLRDRRHASVFAWSIGNEMFERGDAYAVELSKEMAALIRDLDQTRPVTVGVNGLGSRSWSDLDALFAPLDMAGYNYAPEQYALDHERLPGRVMMGTESYADEAFVHWHETTTRPWVVGDFVWTAIDYLGEAGLGRVFPPGQPPKKPWEADMWPWRGAVCGDIDLLGHRKPVSHYRQIVWDRGAKLHAAVEPPHEGDWGLTPWSVEPSEESWTWEVEEGTPLNVVVSSRWPKVRVLLNGKSVGEAVTTEAEEFRATIAVPYEPGELIVVGLKEEGAEAERFSLRTANTPRAIRLTPDRTDAIADRQSLVFIDADVVDDHGVVHPLADRVVRFKVEGPATIQAVGNVDLTNHGVYAGNSFSTYRGRAQVIVRSSGKPGAVKVTAEAEGVPPATIQLEFAPPSAPR